MNYHIITPMSRWNLFNVIMDNIIEQREASKCSIYWEVIIDDGVEFSIPAANIPEWVRVHKCPNEGVNFWDRCNNSINWFIDNCIIDFNDKYMFLNDDDFYEPLFFNKIKECNSPIIICSMDRGDHTINTDCPFKRHPTHRLLATKDNMKVCHVGIEQIIIQGSILNRYRLPLHVWGDGIMIENIIKTNNPNSISYIEDATVWFNYLEVGRWEK